MSIQTLAPTLLDPLVAIAENKSWTGQDIAREDFSPLDPTPGFTRSRDSANAISQEVARLLNSISGGNESRKGFISPTADQLEYLLGQFTGGVGRELLKAGKTAESVITGEELPSYSVPIVGRFHGNVNEMAAVSSAFYRNLTELNIQDNELKNLRKNKGDVQAYLSENPEARLVQMATAQYNQIKNLRMLRQAALEKGDKERAKTLEEAIKKRMINLNDRYEKLAD
jgi:Leucine-rich repeat (LRR) protein